MNRFFGQQSIQALALAALLLAGQVRAADPTPESYPADLSVWPNKTSHSNSDPWLAENHDRIREMRPRVTIVNFSNEAKREHLEKLVNGIIKAVAEGSRYHGYANPAAPAFLNYEIFKFVDLREPDKKTGNCALVPVKKGVTNGFNFEYQGFFTEQFAEHFGVKDPKNPGRFLRLDELVERGYTHELWMIAETVPGLNAYECVEEKPLYDERFRQVGDKFVQAGNGGDEDQKWTGRSIRLGFINPTRGVGCFMESLSHSMEGTANAKAIPYFRKYFYEYAGHDMDTRYHLPWNSFYPLWGEQNGVEYPDEKTAVAKFGKEIYRIENYVAYGGNVHFPPNARRHYDLENTQPVLSTIEDWRIGSGPGGKDVAKPWTNTAFARYREMAGDCMGPWLVYWRQNMPGLDNKQKDDDGKPMKNWWPFLFY